MNDGLAGDTLHNPHWRAIDRMQFVSYTIRVLFRKGLFYSQRRYTMAARVRGTCNLTRQIELSLSELLQGAKNIVYEVVKQGANFTVKLTAGDGSNPLPGTMMDRIREAIAKIVKQLRLQIREHKCDGHFVSYKLATS